jgi:general secretion pathway protein F
MSANMKFFEIEYISKGERKKTIIPSVHKIKAIKNFKNSSLGVLVCAYEVNEPLSYKMQNLKEKFYSLLKKRKIPLEPYIITLRHIAVMLDAGIPINTCLKNAINAIKHKYLKEIFQNILLEIESGISLTNAVKPFSDQLGKISVAMIDLGEQTGTLSESISRLADTLQEIHDNRVRLKKATRYPLITIFAMIVAFSLVIILVVPQFEKLFKDYQTGLPFPTLLLLWTEHAINIYGPYVAALSVVIALISATVYKKSYGFRLLLDRVMLKVYIVGRVIYLSMIGRFIYVFDRLTKAGIPIIDALNTALDIVDNVYLRQRLLAVVRAIGEGRSLTQGFKETGQFESMIIQMISAGETSGSLNAMFDKITIYFQNKYKDLVDNVATLIEPLLIIAIAGFVLLLALGIFLPMWSIAEVVGGV